MKLHVSVILAVLSAAVMLAAIFFPELGLQPLHARLLEWAVILVGVGMLLGIFNLLKTHWQRLKSSLARPAEPPSADGKPQPRVRRRKQPVAVNSAVLLLGFVITFAAGMWLTPANLDYQKAVAALQIPVETSLFALLSVTLLVVSFQFFQRKQNVMGIVFMASVLLFLILGSGMLHMLPDNGWLKDSIAILNELPLAGTRGILIGIALGSLLAAIRQILGTSRVYRE